MASISPAEQRAYPRAVWRLIIEREPHSAAENMALDEAIMDAVAAGDVPPTLRFYQWAPPGLSLGRRQPLSGVDLEACARDGVDAVRRVTGGFAILHTDELTYSVATTPDDPRAAGAILDAYRRLSEGLLAGLCELGVAAAMNPVVPGGTHNASAACFEVPSAYEITADGQKLIGSAQARPAGRVLQHGSLPLRGDIARVVSYLTFATEAEREALASHLRDRATTLSALLSRAVTFDEAAQALVAGFAAALNLDLVADTITTAEERVATAKRPEKVVWEGVAR
jgi:lipoate-protein ligase A